MFRFVVVLAVIACAFAFMPSRMARSQMTMSAEDLKSKFSKALGVAAMGIALAGPMPALADGAASASTVFRAKNYYGARILGLESAAEKGDFAAFEDKRIKNGFDLFVSGSNRLNSQIAKERKAAETVLEGKIYAAVKAKDAAGLKSAYGDFIKVSELKASGYKPNELGQTDSSGYSPTWGTSKQYIYQR